MTEFASMSEVLNRLSGGNSGNPETLFYIKDTQRYGGGILTFSRILGKTYSLWTADGGSVAHGAVPTTAAVPTSATRGAIALTNASGGREKRILCITFHNSGSALGGSQLVHELIVYDRLLHVGNLDGTNTGAQNVQSGSGVSLTRHTGGVGNEIWVEVYGTALGTTTGRTATCSYTNQAGTAGRTTQAMPIGGGSSAAGVIAINEVGRMQLQAGDSGVRSVETLTLSGSTGTAGVFGVTIANRIAAIPMQDGTGVYDFTYGDSGTYVLEDNACIAVMLRGSGSVTHLAGVISTAER